MAPSGANKRKRPDRQTSHDDGPGRPSPHRPENLGMAQQNSGSRGGRGSGGRRQSRQAGPQSPATAARSGSATSKNAASPAAAPPQPSPLQRDSPAIEGSRPATPSQSTVAASQPPAEGTTEAPRAPYYYEHIPDSVVESWQVSGKQAVVKLVEDAQEFEASSIIQELVRSALDNRLDASEAGGVIQHMISHHSGSDDLDAQSLFLNTLSLLDEADMRSSRLLSLVSATNIDDEVIRQELDIPLLQALTLVRSTFTQMRTRKTTNILYRQANFNLLREETEGYAKLITEYFNTANEAVSNPNVSAEAAFQRIKALVGSFDLDVGRVLDITLDISANLLVRAYGFFVKFYRCSSWWPESGVLDNVKWEDQGFGAFPKWALPGSDDKILSAADREKQKSEEAAELAVMRESRDVKFWQRIEEVGVDAFFELGFRKIVDFDAAVPLLENDVPPETDARGKEINTDRRKRINENRKFMRETGTLPATGNSDAAQLLGFKLRFYASSARDSQDTLPENLIYLAALLIKIGFISLRDLYPHLYPTDEQMPEEKTRLEKEKAEKEAKERPGIGSNALAMAGALTDDTLPVMRTLRDKERSGGNTPKPEKKEEEPKEELPTPSNQKIILLKALLLIGALPEALYILGRFPWLVDADISLPPYLTRVANMMLSKVASLVRPLSEREHLRDAKMELVDTNSGSAGSLRFKSRDSKKTTRWLGLDRVDETDGLSYRHYYPDWDDNIPLCQNVEDVFLLCNTFLGFLGLKIGQDPKLLGTLLRIAKHSLIEDESHSNRARWLDLMRRLLVPALSLSKHNAGLTQEVWELLKFFPTTTRYHIYAEWFQGKTSRLPDMRVAFSHNKAEVKSVLLRVSKDNLKKQSRALGKVSFSSPGIVTMNMINQLESYSNMISTMVECTRYFHPLAYDVLLWSLINSLNGRGRDRMQDDGMLTSPWLRALSQFVSSLFFAYSTLNPAPILQYLASELQMGDSTDLELLEQLLTEMGGIRSDIEFNDAQVLAMAGGEHLQARTMLQLSDRRYLHQKQAQRLIKALADPGLIGPTLVAIAQQRQMYPHHDSSKFMPLKVLGNNLDKIQQVFAQYLEVLKTNLKPVDFEATIPDLLSLIGDFGLEPGIAFTICRSVIVHRIAEYDAAKKQEAEEKKRRLSQEQAQTNGDIEMEDGEAKPVTNGDHPLPETSTTPQPSGRGGASDTQPWHPVLEPIIQELPLVSTNIADRVSVPFFATFWTLTLQDILVHPASYENEVNRLKKRVSEIAADRSDASTTALRDREKKKKELLELQDKLRDELKARIAVYQKTRNRISREEKDHWFSRSTVPHDIDARHLGLLQECFIPRAILSSLDAQYCFVMLKLLHDTGTPGFSTMHLFNQLLKKQELTSLIFQFTAMEAQHFGRFLCEVLKLLQHWHADKAMYDREAIGEKRKLPGFAKKLDDNGEPEIVVDYEVFRRLVYNWHTYLYHALQMCFESDEYMHIMNAIIVLKAIVQFFPSLNFQGHKMVELIKKISERDSERHDLKVAATALLGSLKSREKHWIMPQAFRLNDPVKEAGKAGSRQPSARPETPQPTNDTAKLNATAPEFKPGSAGVTNGNARKESVAGKEDGEIEDEKTTALTNGNNAPKDGLNGKLEAGASEATNSKPEAKEVAAPSTVENEKVASKPPTPAPLTTKPPPPPSSEKSKEPSRPSSAQPPPPPRSHALPSRPEARPPGRPLPAAPNDRSAGRHSTRGDEKYGRLDRPSELRPGSRDHSPGRSRARTPEREPYSTSGRGYPRDDRGPARSAPDSRYSRDDAWATSRRDQPPHSGYHSRPNHDSRDRVNGSMGPPPLQNSSSDRAGYSNSAPSARGQQQDSSGPQNATQSSQAQTDSVHHVNPDRMALINKDQNDARDRGKEPPSQPPDSRRDQDAREERSSRQGPGRNIPPESPRDSRSRPDQPSDLAPTGPRRGSGRLSRDLGSQAPVESSYGRLNVPQDVPSGPRAPNAPSGRGGRNFAAAMGSRANDSSLPSPTTSRPPESPSAPRGPAVRPAPDRRSTADSFNRQTSSDSVPTAPAADSGPPVHPSRMGQVGVQPSPLQTNLPASTSRAVASPTSAPPSGPRGSGRPPTGPSPSSAVPPSGPASARETQRSRQRASINATLQGAGAATGPNGQGVSFRGAAQGRPSNVPMSGANAQPVSAIASPLDPPSRRNEHPRQDDSRQRSDLFQGREDRGDANDSRSTRRREDERQERHRGSRDTSRDGRSGEESRMRQPAAGGEDSRRAQDSRDGPPPRDGRGQERMPRNGDPGPRRQEPPSSFSGPPPDWDRSGERRGPRRDGPDDSRRGGRSSGRTDDFRGSRREDERRDMGRPQREGDNAPPPPPPPPPPARKRRHEEPPFDESKRRRSNR